MRLRAVIAVIVIAVALVAVAFGKQLVPFAVAKGIGFGTHTSIAYDTVDFGSNEATFTNVRVHSRGEPLAQIARLYVRYDLRDLLPGSTRLYGLEALTVDHPVITIVRHVDGSTNLPPSSNAQPTGPAPQAAPLRFIARVRNGALSVLDEGKKDRRHRYLYLENFDADATFDTTTRSAYTVNLAYREGTTRYPARGVGTIDAVGGAMMQHWTAAKIPLPQLLEYALNSPNISVQSGSLDRIDARYFGVADNAGNMHGNLTTTAMLDGMRIAMAGIAKPLRDLHGTIVVSEHGLLAPRLDGRIAGVPLQITGGMVNFADPQFRLTVHGNGDVKQLRTLVATRIPQEASGPVAFDLRIEGPATKPLMLAAFSSPKIQYGGMPLERPHGLIAIAGHEADVFGLETSYQGIDVHGRGRIAFQREPQAVELFAAASGTTNRIPYANAFVQPLPVHASVLATGDDPKQIQTQGFVSGHDASQRILAAFRVAIAGTGSVAPLEVARGDRTLYANLQIDRPHNTLGGLVAAHRFELRPVGNVALAGLHVPSLPQVAGTLDGNMYAQQQGQALGAIGALNVRDARFNALPISQARVAFDGSIGNVTLTDVHAQGPWGTLNAAGHVSGTDHVALQGRYAGSLSALASVAGNVPAKGNVRSPVAMLYDGNRLVAQIDRAQFSGADVSGVPLKDFSATVATRNDGVQIYAAHAHIARRGDVLASGSVGRRNNVAVSVAHVDLGALGQKNMPVQDGAASLAANITGTTSAPHVNGSALLHDAALRGYPLNAAASFNYANSALALNGATVALGPAYANIDGVVTPMLDLHATLQGVDAHALAEVAQPNMAQQVAGTINADVRVRGNAAAPSIAGIIDVPEGAYHGLAFRDLRANLNGNARMLAFGNGSVMVGTTAVAFNGSAGSGGIAGSINAPHAELADFDDYFDTADTLGGHGSVRASVAYNGGAVSSSGAVALVDARYRRIPIGDAVAHWHNSGSRVVGDADIGGESGRLAFNGSADIARHDVRGRVSARNVDLRTWLPIAGVQAPVTGLVNGDANVAGAFPDVTVVANAGVLKGTFGRVMVHRLDVAANIVRGRGELRSAHLQLPYFNASASGTFGLHPRDPIAIAMNAESPNLAALAQSVTGRMIDANGSLRTTADLAGTLANPNLTDNFSLDDLRYQNMRVPRVYGTVVANRKTINVRNVQANLQRGTLAVRGSWATNGAHPLNAQVIANDVEASNFVTLMPRGTKMNGRVDGTVTVRGTERAPSFGGELALRDGTYIGPAEAEPIAGAHAILSFAGTGVTLRNTSARVGGGTVIAQGAASMRNLRDPKTLAFNLSATADRARLNMPKYLRGEVNGNVSVTHAAAQRTMVAGNLFVPTARLPVSLFYNPNAPQTPSGPPPDVGFDMHLNIGNDVRVQSGNIDVGAQGALAVAGTLANPQLSGDLASTGGTLDFFRRFFIQQATLHFDPANGIMPNIDAVATTTIPDPQTDVALHVTGLAPSNLNVAFDSDPSYNRDQILGLLVNAQAIGAVPGVKTTTSGTPFSAGNQIQNLAMGQLNTFFTRSLLEPLSAQIGSQLGFENFQVTGDFTGGLGLSAAKAFGKNLTAMFAENMGTPRRQSLDVRAHGKKDSSIDFLMYQADNPNVIGLFSQSSTTNMNAFSNSTMPLFTGTNGFSLTYGHLWQ